MEYRKFCRLYLAVSLLSLSTLFVRRHSQEYFRWSRVRQTDAKNVSINKQTPISGQRQQHLMRLKPFGGENQTRLVRSKLSRSIANVEHDVLNLKVRLSLTAMPDVPLEENRLIHKIQRAEKIQNADCVIRIAKYCAKHCDYLLRANHSRYWTPFQCNFSKTCRFETRFVGRLNPDIMQTVDIVLIVPSLHDGLQLKALMDIRPTGQLWILFSRESPIHDTEYAPHGLTGNPFNLTMTYSRDSDIYFPYCTLNKKHVHPPPIPKKTKLIAWMSSNCRRLSWRREEFVRELQRHVSVDTYGKCGDKGHLPSEDAGKTLSQYKFYLAFENSECRDYISEKPWRTCLLQGIVPIVYGAERKDYEQLLPKNSFIYIEDFSNMSAFVNFIHALDADEARYKMYFDWRSEVGISSLYSRSFIKYFPEVNLCYLVKKLIHLYIHPETSWHKKTPDFASWWRGQCLDPNSVKNVLGFNVHQAKVKKGKQPR